MVQSKAEVLEILQANRNKIEALGVSRPGLFGSFVRDTPNSESDVDIMTEFKPGEAKFRNLMDIYYVLEDIAGRKINVTTKDSLSEHRAPGILSETEYVF